MEAMKPLVEYTPIIEHHSVFPLVKSFRVTGDDFYETVEQALSEALYQTTGNKGRDVICLGIMMVDTVTGETQTVIKAKDIDEAIRVYVRSQLTEEELEGEWQQELSDRRKEA